MFTSGPYGASKVKVGRTPCRPLSYGSTAVLSVQKFASVLALAINRLFTRIHRFMRYCHLLSVNVVGVLCSREFVGWLVRSTVRYARRDFSKTTSPVFTKFGTDVQHFLSLSVNRSRSKLKVQGHHRRIGNLPFVRHSSAMAEDVFT